MYLANNWVSVRIIYLTSVHICITIVISTPIYLRVHFFHNTKYSQTQYCHWCSLLYCMFVILKKKNLMWYKAERFLKRFRNGYSNGWSTHNWFQALRGVPYDGLITIPVHTSAKPRSYSVRSWAPLLTGANRKRPLIPLIWCYGARADRRRCAPNEANSTS